jgi:hypothetical protein
MRQAASDFKQALTNQAGNSAEPTLVGDGVAPSDGIMRLSTYAVKVRVTGTGSIKVGVRGLDASDEWNYVGENDGLVNLGAAITAGTTRTFYLRDAGIFKRFAAVTSASSGAPVTNVWFYGVVERGD